MVAGCSILLPSPVGACSLVAETAVITGPLVSRDGSVASFHAEQVVPGPYRGTLHGPVPAVGALVPVRYEQGEQQFLSVGRRYEVPLYWIGETKVELGYGSEVLTAQAGSCHGAGTTYADGTAIDTKLWRRAHVRDAVYAAVFIALVLLPVLSARAVARRRRRKRNDFFYASLEPR